MITNLVAMDDRILAFGVAGICWPDACSLLPPNGGAVVFESSDGITWRRLPDGGLEEGAVRSVVRGGPGLVAAGYVADAIGKADDNVWQAPTDAAVWTSPDGHTWTPAAMPPEEDEAGSLWVLADGSVALVAGDGLDAAYWRSGDGGQTWQELFLIGDACCGTVTVPFGATVVSVRRLVDDLEGPSSDVRVASLADERPWLRSITTLPGFDALSLTVVGDELLLAGHLLAQTDILPEVIRPVLYVSRDARTWTEVAQPSSWGDLSILRLTLGAHAIVAQLGESDLAPPVLVHDDLWVAPAR
jgi:hypothetical protein